LRIIFFGGLGNQLFQYTFLHYINKNMKKNYALKIIKNTTERIDRNYQLDELTNYCSHVSSTQNNNKFIQIIENILRKIPEELNLMKKIFYKLENNSFVFEPLEQKSMNNFSIIRGYFQNWVYVEEVFDDMRPEFEKIFKNISIDIQNYPKNFIGLHVRRGDSKFNLNIFGTLTSSYYLKVIQENQLPNIPIILFTDDLLGASDVIDEIKPDLVIGPESLCEWETLYLMSRATYLITANSTFSWWGGYLGKKIGRIEKVYLPNPWFMSPTVSTGEAFLFPGSTIATSEFIGTEGFETNYEIP
jgi:Glycosyl transferase family 11